MGCGTKENVLVEGKSVVSMEFSNLVSLMDMSQVHTDILKLHHMLKNQRTSA